MMEMEIISRFKSVVRRLILAASVYNVWKERNGRLFRDAKRSSDEVFKNIVDTMKNRLVELIVKESCDVRKMQSKWGISCKRAKVLT